MHKNIIYTSKKAVNKLWMNLGKSCVCLSTQMKLPHTYTHWDVEKLALIHRKHTLHTHHFQQLKYAAITPMNKLFIHNFHSTYYYTRTIKNLKGL